MANITLTAIPMTPETKTETEIVSIRMNKDVRFKSGSTTTEEYRWICTVVIKERWYNVLSIDSSIGNADVTTNGPITGTFQGGTELAIYTSMNDQWSLIDDGMQAIEASGSKFVEKTQTWVSASEWATITW